MRPGNWHRANHAALNQELAALQRSAPPLALDLFMRHVLSHMETEEQRIFPHLPAAARRQLLEDHTRLRALMSSPARVRHNAPAWMPLLAAHEKGEAAILSRVDDRAIIVGAPHHHHGGGGHHGGGRGFLPRGGWGWGGWTAPYVIEEAAPAGLPPETVAQMQYDAGMLQAAWTTLTGNLAPADVERAWARIVARHNAGAL
jgi:hypothetical protein